MSLYSVTKMYTSNYLIFITDLEALFTQQITQTKHSHSERQ